jgi:hypothetical protein
MLYRILLENARYMRLNARLPKSFWPEAVNYASPFVQIDFKVPEEVWSGKSVDYSVLKIFVCLAYVHVQRGKQSKLYSKSKKYIFLGLETNVKGYRLWDLDSNKKIVSKEVFDEAYMLGKGEDGASTDNQKGKQVVEVEFDDQSLHMDKCDEWFSRDLVLRRALLFGKWKRET